MKRLDGIKRSSFPRQIRPTVTRESRGGTSTVTTTAYPDLSEVFITLPVREPLPITLPETPPVEKTEKAIAPRPARRRRVARKEKALVATRPVLRVVHKSLLRSGISWFLVFAVLSSSAIGLFSIAERGRAAKDQLTQQAGDAKSQLSSAASALSQQDLETAIKEFSAASASFSQMEKNLSSLSTTLKALIALAPGDPLGAASALAQAGVHLSNAGVHISEVVRQFGDVDLSLLSLPDQQKSSAGKTITTALHDGEQSFSLALQELEQGAALLETVDVESLPSSIRQDIEPVLQQVPSLASDLQKVHGLFGVLATIAGAERAMTYVIAFQNNNELRPTGGFIGALAFLKIQEGRVEKVDIKSVYDPAGQVKTQRRSPAGLNVVSKTFALQDGNWWGDFPTSSKALLNFFAETGDPKIDGVIALNPNVISQLLSITGPVTLDELALQVNEDNFVTEAQYEVPDKDPEREKKFFPSFAQGLFSQLFALDRAEWSDLASLLLGSIVKKDIQVFFADADAQALSQQLGSAGVFPESGVDLLADVQANIGGGKTDQFISEERELTVTVGREIVRHELTVKVKDTRVEQFKDRDNRRYHRLYVPSGSTLVEATGFDTDLKELIAYDCEQCVSDPMIASAEESADWEPLSNSLVYQEGDWQVFANWVTLRPGEERTLKLTYETPLASLSQDQKTMKLFFWKQPGLADAPLDLQIKGTDGRAISYVTGGDDQHSAPVQRIMLDQDRVIGIMFQ
jgi:hypothetical protein